MCTILCVFVNARPLVGLKEHKKQGKFDSKRGETRKGRLLDHPPPTPDTGKAIAPKALVKHGISNITLARQRRRGGGRGVETYESAS
jgi:hypothetical protein